MTGGQAAGSRPGQREPARFADPDAGNAATDSATSTEEAAVAEDPGPSMRNGRAPAKIVDHITIGVSDLERSRAFYTRALAPLGFAEAGSWDDGGREVSFGVPGGADFAISVKYGVGAATHVAFVAQDREQVAAFYEAALAAGGRDHGGPAPRPEYSAGYYGAFVLDPDGHNIEAVVHEADG
jgi:catechol 2,3-dioxygenase-like lactoylglutathione lyase family enzyme